MAIDTRAKRQSANRCAGVPLGVVGPEPDGSVDQDDRRTIAFVYGGILVVAVPLTEPFTALWTNPARTATWTDPTRTGLWTDPARTAGWDDPTRDADWNDPTRTAKWD